MKRRVFAILAIAAAGCSASQAAQWNESLRGDLSDDGLAPSTLLLEPGTNHVAGAYGNGDRDYLTVTVPAGLQLVALRVAAGMSTAGVRSFVGVQAGAQMTVPPGTDDAGGLLGWAHVGFALPGTDVLAEVGQGFGATGFAGPLQAGAYTWWIQETGRGSDLRFAYDFVLAAPVPEPAVAWLTAMGLALVVARSRSIRP